jgi:hypothetical protein
MKEDRKIILVVPGASHAEAQELLDKALDVLLRASPSIKAERNYAN